MSIELNIKPDSWYIFNIKQAGFYRVHYADSNWEKLTKQLIADHKVSHRGCFYCFQNTKLLILPVCSNNDEIISIINPTTVINITNTTVNVGATANIATSATTSSGSRSPIVGSSINYKPDKTKIL